MRIAALVHFSLPHRNCGSEVVLHELLKSAQSAGHDVIVWTTHKDAANSWRGTEPDTVFDGITIKRVRNSLVGERQVRAWKPDVIVSHHQHTAIALRAARQIKARSVYLVHNDFDLNRRPLQNKPDLVVFNSDWVRESLSRFGAPRHAMTFHPPLTPDRHTVPSTGDGYTLINLNADKGAHTFYELARLEPDRKFVGVIGGHGVQIVKRNMPNVEILDHDPDMRRVWSRTRVLLMPSVQESYGLTAAEAGINGIPTIAHPTQGLLENLGAGGLFADRDSVNEWRHKLSWLDDPNNYSQASEHAKGLACDAMDATRRTLERWLEWLAA